MAEILEDYSTRLESGTVTIRTKRDLIKASGPAVHGGMRDIISRDVEQRFRAIEQDAEPAARQARSEAASMSPARRPRTAPCAAGEILGIRSRAGRQSLAPCSVRGRRLQKQWHNLEKAHPPHPKRSARRLLRGGPASAFRHPARLVLIGLFTGSRDREASGFLRWDEVDLVNKTINVAAARMKSRRAFQLPMSDLVNSA